MRRWAILLVTHGAMLAAGFAAGIYFLPILTAPQGPEAQVVDRALQEARYRATFRRDLKGSDFLHWGEGEVAVAPRRIAHSGRLSPGPDYKLYLVPDFVEDQAGFLAIKDRSARIGDVKTFDGFVLDVPEGVDVNAYTTVLVWCEAFREFITAAKYR